MHTVERILDQRSQRVTSTQRRRAWVVSLITHSLIAGGVWAASTLKPEPPPKPTFIPLIRVIPPAALGVRKPPPPPQSKPKPKPKPEPKVVKPPPPPPKPKPAAPVIATKKPKPKPPPPTPAPAPPPPPALPEVAKRQGILRGNPLGSSSSAQVGVEDPDFTYGYYLDQMIAILSRNWVRPQINRRLGKARLYYRIQRNGTIADLRLVDSSGSDVFDQAALRAIEASIPLPPLPRGYKRDYLGINLQVE